MATATVAAQTVVVSNPIDPNVDLSSLQLPGIVIVDHRAQFPSAFDLGSGRNALTTIVDLRPSQNLLVKVDAKLDTGTRLLTWTFALDPVSGTPLSDPTVGFLAPGAQSSVFLVFAPITAAPATSRITPGDPARIARRGKQCRAGDVVRRAQALDGMRFDQRRLLVAGNALRIALGEDRFRCDAALKVSAVIAPTPGTLMSRWQTLSSRRSP